MGAKYFLILLLVFLAACQPYIQATPTSEHQQTAVTAPPVQNQTNACATVACPKGQVCQKGVCTCPFGQKMCGNSCIDKKACCLDTDCASGACDNGKCVPAPDCAFGEVYKNGTCGCTADKIYCKEQKKCIGKSDCCIHSNCGKFERCVQNDWKASLCAKADTKKVCKIIAEKTRGELFDVNGTEFRVNILNWLSDGSIDFNISNQTVRLETNMTIAYGNVTLYQEGIQVNGGFCKEDEDVK